MDTNLTDKILKGDIRAAARLMRDIEDESPGAIKEMGEIYLHTGRAYIVGIAGAPGVGKSTMIDMLISNLREHGSTIGVVTIDPSSPFTGGAVLGDRIRMQRHSTDPEVFIRSLATRGCLGGLSKATTNIIHIMDAMKKDFIIVETVGIGQIEVDVVKITDTTILVLNPGMGDAIQIMKAGILEGASIFAINHKADEESARKLKMELQFMLDIRQYLPNEWKPSIVIIEALHNKGIDTLVKEIIRHRDFLTSSGALEKHRREKAKLELSEAIEDSIRSYVNTRIDRCRFEGFLEDLVQKRRDPYSAASEIIKYSTKSS